MGAALARRGRKAKQGKRVASAEYAEPTPEQLMHGVFVQGGNLATSTNERNGNAYRRVPMITTLAASGYLTQRQYDALHHYREKANAADRSPIRGALDFSLRGNGEGLPHFGVIINRELEFLDGVLGADLKPTVWAIAVMDRSPSQWAIDLFGSVIRVRQRGPWQIHSIEPRTGCLRLVQRAICDAGDKLAKALAI